MSTTPVYLVVDQLPDFPEVLGAYLDRAEAQAARERASSPPWVEVQVWLGDQHVADVEREVLTLEPSTPTSYRPPDIVELADGTLRSTYEAPSFLTSEDMQAIGDRFSEGLRRGLEVEAMRQRLEDMGRALLPDSPILELATSEGWQPVGGVRSLSLTFDDEAGRKLWDQLDALVPDPLKPAREALVAQGWTAPAWGYRNGALAPIERMTA